MGSLRGPIPMNQIPRPHTAPTAAEIRALTRNLLRGCRCIFTAATLLTVAVGSKGAGAAGAAGPEDWPYSRPVDAPPPEVKSADRVVNPLDAFVLQKLEATGLTLAPEADRRTLVRRLYFNLIGLPPTPEQVEAFVNNTAQNAYGELVDSLLADPRYGERWAKFWLDLARYADTAGYEGDPDLPHAWRYRDYVIDSLNRDKPYDEFIREQIAGDEFEEIMGAGELPSAKPEQAVALTFLRLAPFTEPRGDETRHEMLSEMTSTVSSVFLGLTVGCAKCHDHKYDKIPIKDFYRMQAFFNTVQIAPPERGDIFQIGGPMPADFYREGEKEWAENKRQELHGIQGQLDTLRADFGKRAGSALPDEMQLPDAKQRADQLDDWISNPANEAITAAERKPFLELKEKLPFVKQHLKRLQPVAMSLRHSFGPPYESGVPVTRVMLRGEYDKPGEPVEAGFLSCITGNSEPAKIRLDPFKRWPTRSRRMTLAQWIASPENPLTARVMVNRLWAQHFGRGIVPTLSDFGKLSGGPSHPELLDWLAHRFVENNWSLKAMHRLMVSSGTYRQSSVAASDRAALADPDNSLLSRSKRRRIEAEAVRDAVLAVSGRLNPEVFGLPIFPPLPEDIAQRVKYDQSKWATDNGPEGRKRSLYIYQQRTLTMPFMQSFDGLVCEDSVPERRLSVTPLQALEMYNGDLVNEEVKHFAARIIKDAGDDPQRRIERAFAIAFGRAPTTAEIMELRDEAASEEKLTGLCRILFNASEFVYVD